MFHCSIFNSLILSFKSRSMVLSEGDQSAVIMFILLGFSEYPHLLAPLFLVFLTIYTVTLVGNLGIIVIIRTSLKLHTPMYFFLSHLSFLDICSSSVFTPKLLGILVVEDRIFSFKWCMAQFFFGCAFVIMEMSMLAATAYDQFVAVCNPLLYTVAVSPKLCSLLVAGTYTWGIMCSLTITCSLLELSFCSSMSYITLAVSILPSPLLPVLTPISVNWCVSFLHSMRCV